jgi:hypothetical protein
MWNYRVIRKENKYIDRKIKKERIDYTYAIHEAYYDDNGHVGAITQDPVEPFGENIEELRHSWVMMAEAFGKPILDYDKIPEPGYDRKKDPIGSEHDNRLNEIEAGNKDAVPLGYVKKELGNKWGPFDEEAYQKQVGEERLEKERIHSEAFIGTPTLKELIRKIYSNYQEYTKQQG